VSQNDIQGGGGQPVSRDIYWRCFEQNLTTKASLFVKGKLSHYTKGGGYTGYGKMSCHIEEVGGLKSSNKRHVLFKKHYYNGPE